MSVHPQDTKCTPSQSKSQFLGQFLLGGLNLEVYLDGLWGRRLKKGRQLFFKTFLAKKVHPQTKSWLYAFAVYNTKATLVWKQTGTYWTQRVWETDQIFFGSIQRLCTNAGRHLASCTEIRQFEYEPETTNFIHRNITSRTALRLYEPNIISSLSLLYTKNIKLSRNIQHITVTITRWQ